MIIGVAREGTVLKSVTSRNGVQPCVHDVQMHKPEAA